MKTKEAIERVRSRFDKWALDDEDLTALQTLGFVDTDSEDERIRKEIVKYLTNELNNVEQLTPRTNEYERWITWLSLKFRVGDTISFKSKQYTIVGIDFDNHCYDLNDDECVDFDTAHYQYTLEKQKPSSTEETELNSIAFLEQLGYTCIPPSEQKPAERVEINKSLRDAVIAELNKYTSENYWRSPWALDSTGVQYPLYFANLGATWQKEQKLAEKPINWTELTWEDINELEDIINEVHYEFRNGIGQESFGKEVLEKFREYKGDEYFDEIEQKPVKCIEFDNEFKNQVSHLLASVLNKEWEYDKEFVEYAAQQLLGYAKHEIEPRCPQFVYDDILALEDVMGIVYRKGNEQELYEALRSLHSRLIDTPVDNVQKEQKPAECDKETDIQKAYREGQNAGRQEVFDNLGAYGLEKIDNVFGFRIGDKVRLVDGDGRPHIIKYFEKIEGLHGPDFYHVVFEDNTASDHIIPGNEYPSGYFTQMEKFEEEQKSTEKLSIEDYIKKFKALCDAYEIKLPNREYDIYHLCKDLHKLFGDADIQKPIRWSEEDKRLLRTTLECLNYISCQSKTPVVNWLNSLPERFNLQPKQEWSEDFEDNIRNLLHDKLTGHNEDRRISWATLIDDKTLKDIVNGIWFYVGKEALKYPNKELSQPEWSEDWREEDIQTRFAFYTYKDNPSELYLSNVFVEEASRNHGLGTRILRAAEKVAETIGATTICLKVKMDSPANAWYRKNGYGYVTFEDGYDWLEKNLEYMKPNMQEWGEEDKKMIDHLIEALPMWATGRIAMLPSQADEYVKRLKSLRPQPHTVTIKDATKFGNLEYERGVKDGIQSEKSRQWKPSEEQMNALEWAANWYSDTKQCDPVLYSLLSDLKKHFSL